METTDTVKFSQVMDYLSLNFPEREVGPNLLQSYFSDLSEYSIDDVWKAARAYVRTGDKFPLLSDLIRLLSA
jgi:hypothetical protein